MPAFDDVALTTLLIAIIALAAGGFAKGLLGVGLPMVATPVLSTFAPIPDVVAVMYFPILATNIWQALTGGYLAIALKRFWPMLLTVIVMIPAGTWSLVVLDAATVSVLLGCAVTVFALASLLSPKLHLAPRFERPASILAGAVGGYFGGMVLIGGPPVIMLMVALRAKKEEFIGTMGLVYMCMLVPVGFTLVGLGVLEGRHVGPGVASLVPVLAALAVGQWLRGKFDEDRFRRMLLGTMVLIGLNLIRKGLF